MSRLSQFDWAIPALVVLSLLAPTAVPRAPKDPPAATVPVEDYPVYNAVLGDIQFSRLKPEDQIHALIVNDTINLNCGEKSGNPIMLNNCSPMMIPPTTAAQLHSFLAGEFQLQDSTWSDWLATNAKSWRLQEHFKTPWKHGLTGSGLDPNSLPSPEWDNADCAFYFSRVGFDETKKEALVFVYFASYMSRAPSSGDYFLLHQQDNNEWKIDGRTNYFTSTKDADKK